MSAKLWKHWSVVLSQNGVNPENIQGYSFILAVAAIWVTASFVVQEIEAGGLSPFVLTFLCNSTFILYIPLVEATNFINSSRDASDLAGNSLLPKERRRFYSDDGSRGEVEAGVGEEIDEQGEEKEMCSRWETAKAALVTFPVWFGAQFCFNLSLSKTSVTANTILSSLATLFTFLLSVALLSERFTARKLAGIALCTLGTALVTSQDGSEAEGGSSSTVFGDALCLLSACLYAVYTIMIRKLLPNDGEVNMALFFGYVGFFNVVFLVPVVMVMQTLGSVDMWSLNPTAVRLTFLKGIFDNMLSAYLWSRAVLLVGPTVASAGMGIQVPLAMLVEMIIGRAAWLKHVTSACMMLGGGISILIGFLIVSIQPVF